MPDDARLEPARRALLIVLGGFAAFGAALVLAPGPVGRLFGWIAWGSAGRPAEFGPDAMAYVQLVHAIVGAVTVGWALTLLGVVAWFWRRDARRAWLLVAVPMAAWFALDTAFSLWSGFWRNAVFNSLFALALAVPLALLRRSTAGAPHGRRERPAPPATGWEAGR